MKRILFIEDDQQLTRAYKLKFENDYFVDIAEDGTTGLALFKENRPDIVILDIMLPGGLNGFDILTKIKNDPNQSSTPVIMLTNLESEEKTALELGATSYIVKANTNLIDIENLVIGKIGK